MKLVEPKKSKWDLLWLLLLLFPVYVVVTRVKPSEVNNSNFLDGYDYTGTEVNRDLFYYNKGQIQAADPDVIMHNGKYYLYATNANGNADCSYLQCWSSINLTDWKNEGICFQPELNRWCIDGLWAPEVIEKDGTFYMYYAGWSLKRGIHEIGVATSSSPTGPFIEVPCEETLFDFNRWPVIDPSPFIDDNGDAYLLITKDQYQRVSSIYSVKLNDDMISVDMSTLTLLLEPSLQWERNSAYTGGYWNEAPYMIKHNNQYYLFYSSNYYMDREYAVGVAVSSSPTGPFTKYDAPILQAKDEWDYISGTGHCSVFNSADGKELFMAYHSHKDTIMGGSERLIRFDRLTFINNKVYVNGPSISPQPLPSGSSKYHNIIDQGEVRINGNRVSKINDGIINYDSDNLSYELDTSVTKAQITIKFNKQINAKAIMIYDSANYDYSLREIRRLTINKKKAVNIPISDDYLDTEYYFTKIPMSAFIYEFDEVKTNSITIDLESATGNNILLNEILVLGY